MGNDSIQIDWRCHTPKLFEEILLNPGTAALLQPLIIFRGILSEVAERAIELNDPELNLLMMRLTLYECADPSSESYNPEMFEKLKNQIKEST